jgi:hypothetical protein
MAPASELRGCRAATRASALIDARWEAERTGFVALSAREAAPLLQLLMTSPPAALVRCRDMAGSCACSTGSCNTGRGATRRQWLPGRFVPVRNSGMEATAGWAAVAAAVRRPAARCAALRAGRAADDGDGASAKAARAWRAAHRVRQASALSIGASTSAAPMPASAARPSSPDAANSCTAAAASPCASSSAGSSLRAAA